MVFNVPSCSHLRLCVLPLLHIDTSLSLQWPLPNTASPLPVPPPRLPPSCSYFLSLDFPTTPPLPPLLLDNPAEPILHIATLIILQLLTQNLLQLSLQPLLQPFLQNILWLLLRNISQLFLSLQHILWLSLNLLQLSLQTIIQILLWNYLQLEAWMHTKFRLCCYHYS